MKPYHHGNLRQALLEKGLELLETEGIEALNIRNLAASVGVSTMAPYRHFADKAALLGALGDEGFKLFNRALQSLEIKPDGKDSALQALSRTIKSYMQFARQHPSVYRLMFSPYGFSLMDPDGRMNRESGYRLLIDTVQKAQQTGWRVGAHPLDVAFSVWSILHGATLILLDEMVPRDNQPANPESGIQLTLGLPLSD